MNLRPVEFLANAAAVNFKPGESDPRFYDRALSLRQVSNRVHASHAMSNGYASAMSRCWQINYVPVSQIKIGVDNWCVDNAGGTGAELASGGISTFAVSIEYPAGVFTQIPIGGAATGMIASGATGFTDLFTLPFTIPAFTKYWIRIYVANATMMVAHSWSNTADLANGDRFVFNGGNQTMSGSVIDNGGGVYMIFPALVLAYSNRRVLAAIGDSLTSGVNDMVTDPTGGTGLFGRALAKWGPHMNMGIGGDRMQWFAASSTKRRANMAAGGVAAVINGYGFNDIGAGRTASQLAADRETVRGLFSVPMCDTTIVPQTTSSEAPPYKTASGQSISNGAKNTQRVTHNNALRAGLATSPGLIDIAALVETSTASENGPVKDGGVWLPRLMVTGDGTHPPSHGYREISAEVEKLALMFVG